MKSEAGNMGKLLTRLIFVILDGATVVRFRARRNIIFSETSGVTPAEVAADDGDGHAAV